MSVMMRMSKRLMVANLRHGLLSVGGGLLVLRVGHGEEVLQLPLQGLKRWPLHRVLEKIRWSKENGSLCCYSILLASESESGQVKVKVKVCVYLVPALQHDVVEGGGTTLGRCHSVTMLHLHVVIMMMLEIDGNDCHGCNVDQRKVC